MHLVKNSQLVASDGGGLVKETYFLNKPMLILRKDVEPERGIKETSYLSNLDKKRAIYFIDNFKKYKRRTKIEGSPTKVIADFFSKNR